jgi:hypothetical protein
MSAAEGAQNITSRAFITAIVTNAALLAVQVGVFVVLKQKLGRIYSPRSFLPPVECVYFRLTVCVCRFMLLWSQEESAGATGWVLEMDSGYNQHTFRGYRERCYHFASCLIS